MSTRCNIHFTDGGQMVANVYRHSDGYPEGVLPDMTRFFNVVQREAPDDTRFNDAEYLAARYIVWQAREWSGGGTLAFRGVSPCVSDHGDIEHTYEVDCSEHTAAHHPVVRHL